jgi:hypothetical protein
MQRRLERFEGIDAENIVERSREPGRQPNP